MGEKRTDNKKGDLIWIILPTIVVLFVCGVLLGAYFTVVRPGQKGSASVSLDTVKETGEIADAFGETVAENPETEC